MTRSDAIKILDSIWAKGMWRKTNEIDWNEAGDAIDLAIEALKAQEFDEVVFDMNEFFSIVDNGKITVMRKGRGRVTVERPAIRMETTICSYGERREE